MVYYLILETHEGLTVAEAESGIPAVEIAASQGATLIDPGPFDSYDEAFDALQAIEDEVKDEPTE